jgi:hypothetical protein
LCAILAREAEPSGGPNPARALDRGAGRFLFDLIDGSERWGGAEPSYLLLPIIPRV